MFWLFVVVCRCGCMCFMCVCVRIDGFWLERANQNGCWWTKDFPYLMIRFVEKAGLEKPGKEKQDRNKRETRGKQEGNRGREEERKLASHIDGDSCRVVIYLAQKNLKRHGAMSQKQGVSGGTIASQMEERQSLWEEEQKRIMREKISEKGELFLFCH